MTNLVTPTIHNNGTDGQELLLQVLRILDSLDLVQAAMREASPNPRDYYPQGSDAIAEARKAYYERYAQVNTMIEEFQALAFAIDAQNEARAERSAA